VTGWCRGQGRVIDLQLNNEGTKNHGRYRSRVVSGYVVLMKRRDAEIAEKRVVFRFLCVPLRTPRLCVEMRFPIANHRAACAGSSSS
jgi:hypothetical protein